MRCGGCGYFLDVHVRRGKDVRCPVCACGETVDAHLSVAEPPAPLLAFAENGKITHRCPGKGTQLRHGTFRDPPPPGPGNWRDVIAADRAARDEKRHLEELAAMPDAVRPPIVPARPPCGPHEIAGYQGRQAVGLGRKATALAWDVEAWYWLAGDRSEGCAVRLRKGPLRAVATWTRKAGNKNPRSGWAVDVAYAWRIDVERPATKLTHTDLEGLIR